MFDWYCVKKFNFKTQILPSNAKFSTDPHVLDKLTMIFFRYATYTIIGSDDWLYVKTNK